MSRIVVTGGAGRLGRSVVRGLAEHGHEVVSIDRGRAAGLEVEQLEHDLSDAPATAALLSSIRPERIVHLAAIAVPFSAPDATMMAVNTGLAFSVLEAALACEAESMLVASSPTVIGYGAPGGWSPTSLPIDERHPTAPWNGYALSKVALEQLVAMAARAHGDRLRIGAFRPCYVIAPEEWAESVTYWGITDRGAWLGAPIGLVRADGTRKPSFDRLRALFREEWWHAPTTLRTDADGRVTVVGFAGDYAITAGDARAEFALPLGPSRPTVELPGA